MIFSVVSFLLHGVCAYPTDLVRCLSHQPLSRRFLEDCFIDFCRNQRYALED